MPVSLVLAKLEALHQEVREAEPDVWEPACHQLGELAIDNQEAYRALCDLLLSSIPELRLRGLVALRIMGPAKPREVMTFLTERVAEARTHYDPILLDATFFAFTSLPGKLGPMLVSGYLKDPFDGIRAAAAAALCFWPDWPAGLLAEVASDPSLTVRAGLIAALEEMKPSEETARAVEVLGQSPEPALQELLTELRGERPQGDYLLRELPPFGYAQARELLHSSQPNFTQINRLEEWVTEDLESGLSLLREGLEAVGGRRVVHHLSDASRSSELATLLRAWSRILSRPEGDEELLLQVAGILDQNPESSFLSPFREFVYACAEAGDCAESFEMVAWACTQQVTEAARNLWDPQALEGIAVCPEAPEFLSELAQMGSEFETQSLYQLSSLDQGLSRLRADLDRRCPRPERDLLQIVLERWQRLVQTELQSFVGGESA